MTAITLRRSEERSAFVLELGRSLLSIFDRHRRRRQTTRELHSLDRRLLRDIGIEHPSSIEAMAEALADKDEER